MQFATLVREGLWPESKVLDIGCGALRAGYWLVRFSDPECYFGIEPANDMLESGRQLFLSEQLQRDKRPHFDTNDRFDFAVFGEKFDVYLARSIWSHASKSQIQAMLRGFVETANPEAFFLTSYLPAKWYRRDWN
jgi:SAM-dependent methyltransferase